tara:strand:- start:753 stop:1043 length:291 start_codon:yes stop_codon:yes gene_type:complete
MYSVALSKRKNIEHKNNLEIERMSKSIFKKIGSSKSFNYYTHISAVFQYRSKNFDIQTKTRIPNIYIYPGEFLSSLEAEENINKYGELISPKGLSF